MAMAMATLELAFTALAPQRYSNNYNFPAIAPNLIKLQPCTSFSSLSLNHSFKTRRLCFELCCALQEVETKTEQNTNINGKKKLYVFNLPWTSSAADIKDLFGQCGSVTDVEIIKSKNGRSRGFAFVTMASGEEAQAAVDKFESHEISGRIIKVELAKRFKKPPPPRPPGPPPVETRHVIYVSNLAWKARSTHLRDFFTENFKTPVSARVVFDSPTGRSAGYGFASFLTHEEAEAAISALEGKELMGRPLRLKFSEKKAKEAGSEKDEDQGSSEKDEVQGSGEKDEGQGSGEKDEDQGSDAQLEES